MDGETMPQIPEGQGLSTLLDPNALGPIQDFTQVVTLKAQDKTFYVHKEILTKNSPYFDKALNGPFTEGQTQSITFDDIDPNSLAKYIRLLQQVAYVPDFKLRARGPSAARVYLYPMEALLKLWELGDRFLDETVLAIIEESLDAHWDVNSVKGWSQAYLEFPRGCLRTHLSDLAMMYTLCKERSIPFEKEIVTVCANCPPQVFADIFLGLELEDEFRAEVTKEFALRHANQELAKKRSPEALEEWPSTAIAKRRKTQRGGN
ncbi:hypothetical protein VP1G_10435 [Cytospora mali]|uniref:BTB domain-containing protein n=1 Tax=Cytospora mali TaxID=578113 RepID=A0A194VGZ3_CYTMA|nr:hypothetical protein VP1G_10435 [Valsa mali var. pyri (nom. inval.)]